MSAPSCQPNPFGFIERPLSIGASLLALIGDLLRLPAMTQRYHLIRSCVLALTSFGVISASGQAPEVVLHPFSQIPQTVAFTIRPHSTGWVMLQASSDLVEWHPVVNVLTTNSSVPFVDYSASNAFVRFYRVRSPGISAAQAATAWQAVRPAHYQYSFEYTKLDGNFIVFLGTVTISNGVKTVRNVTANDNPTTAFDPADFLTPDEVFAVIANAESQGAKLAHVFYDEQWSFAAAVVIIPSTTTPMTDYRISEFVDLSGGTGQANQIR